MNRQPARPNAHPTRGRCAARRMPRAGLTLLEILLVLSLMVVIAAISLPSFRGSFENQRLRKAGDQLRIEWNRARIKAMKTGQIQMFRFEHGGTHFQVEPYYTEQDILEWSYDNSDPNQMPPPGSTFGGMPGTTTTQAPLIKEMPEGVMFAGGGLEFDSRAALLDQMQGGQQTMGAAPGVGVSDSSLSAPILFYPDGTTSSARVILGNRNQRYCIVQLRSLTGLARVSDLVSAEMLPQ